MQFRIEKKNEIICLKKLDFKIGISRFELRLVVKQSYLKIILSNSDAALDVSIHQCFKIVSIMII